jgi:hypothetical protein
LVVVAIVLWGCSPSVASSGTGTEVVRGVLLDVESPNIQKVDSFTLRTDAGQELHFTTAPNFNEGVSHVMTPGHMRQHMALGDPVEVTYRDDNGSLVALTAVDVSP